jgi:outer membrane protein
MPSLCKILLACTSVLIGTVPIIGSETWSLKRCIDHALENNSKIEGEHLKTDYLKNRYRQSWADLFPEINGAANQDFRFGRSIDPYTNGYRDNNSNSSGFSLGGSVTLFDGMRKINTIKRNGIDLKVSEKNEAYVKNEITLQVVDAYLMVLFNQELIDVTGRQIDVTRLQVARTQTLVEAGSLSRGNLFELMALAAQEDVELLKAKNQKSINLLTLQQLLELDTLSGFAIVPLQLPDINDTDLQAALPDLYTNALSLPEVQSAEYEIQSASQDLKIEKGKLFPTLSFDAYTATGYSMAYKKYRTVYGAPTQIGYVGSDPLQTVYAPTTRQEEIDYPFSEQVRDNGNTVLSFQLKIPLFNRLQITSAIRNAKINVEQKKLQLELIKKRVLLNVQIAYNEARANLYEYHGNIRAYEAMRESFRYTEEKFNVGMVSSVDYHNGKNLLSKAASDMLQAKYKYYLKKSILEVLCGKQIAIN